MISEDALRRALLAIPEGPAWAGSMATCASTAPARCAVDWDIDTTIKPAVRQAGRRGGVVQPEAGRPWRRLHTYLMAGLRLVMGVEVKAGNEHSGRHTLPGLLRAPR